MASKGLGILEAAKCSGESQRHGFGGRRHVSWGHWLTPWRFSLLQENREQRSVAPLPTEGAAPVYERAGYVQVWTAGRGGFQGEHPGPVSSAPPLQDPALD